MKVSGGIRDVRKAAAGLPEGPGYRGRIVKIDKVGKSQSDLYEIARVSVVAHEEDDSLVGRTGDYFLGSVNDPSKRRGLGDLMAALQLEELEDEDTQSLKGQEFDFTVVHKEGARGLEARIIPSYDETWVSGLDGDAPETDEEAPRKPKKGSKKAR